ncbi:MAG: ABC transporter permease [Deltaproteobacteria bacterium]|nr:ABC transporter permease [Deltaproteobacteria bacterium]MBN2674833.1 ABC transporter permease [Deltaproteobacteria bacterium]
MKQKLRDRVALLLSLFTAPLFVLFYWVLFHDSSKNYQVYVLDDCAANGSHCAPDTEGTNADSNSVKSSSNSAHIQNIQASLRQISSKQGGFTFEFTPVQSRRAALADLRRGAADVVVVFPMPLPAPEGRQPGNRTAATVELLGDVSSSQYQFCAAIIEKGISEYTARIHHMPPHVFFHRVALGVSAKKTPFEAYVPGLLVFAVIMLIFSSAMSVVKEIEAGTFARMHMTPVGTFEMVGGLSVVQLAVGIISVVLTFWVASLLHFQSEGAIVSAMIIATIACAASVGIGMVVAAVAKTQSRAFLLSSIVMFLLVLFSGIIFPRPELTMFHVGDHAVDLFDVLPTTHLGSALNKILALGATLSDVLFETAVLSVIAFFNFIFGCLLFVRSGKPASTPWEGIL